MMEARDSLADRSTKRYIYTPDAAERERKRYAGTMRACARKYVAGIWREEGSASHCGRVSLCSIQRVPEMVYPPPQRCIFKYLLLYSCANSAELEKLDSLIFDAGSIFAGILLSLVL